MLLYIAGEQIPRGNYSAKIMVPGGKLLALHGKSYTLAESGKTCKFSWVVNTMHDLLNI